MNKDSFMSRLDELLKDLPDTERIEALEYYGEYFDDAGVENESSVLQELGSPEEVAHNIKGELAEKELVLRNQQNEGTHKNTAGYNEYEGKQYQQTDSDQKKPKKNTTQTIVLIVLLCILAIPLGVPILSAALGIVVGALATLAGIVIALYAVAIALVVSGIMLFVVGVVNTLIAPLVAALLFGLGLLLFGFGLLLFLVAIKFCTVVLPAVVQFVSMIFHKLFHRGEACAA